MIGALALGLGLAMIAEGLVWALAPGFIDDMLRALGSMDLSARRVMGLLIIVLGLICVWVAGAAGVQITWR